MAEDGMLINFDLGGSGFVPREPVYKGGKWKDRFTARKAAQRNREQQNGVGKSSPRPNNLSEANQSSLNTSGDLRPAKRPRIDSVATTKGSISRDGDGGHGVRRYEGPGSHAGASPAGSKPHQVISSLFRFNPKATRTHEDEEGDTEKGVDQPSNPSNAPLQSELDTFTSLGLSKQIAEHLLKSMNIKSPTAVQRESISSLCRETVDAFIQAETGSGKTLAYLLPIVHQIMALSQPKNGKTQDEALKIHRDSGLFAIILAPTRELSKQISVVLEDLLRCANWIVSGTVIGGEKKKSEKARLRKGLNILIATPGRLADHLDHTEALHVNNVRWLVLDEGDRLMELGFEKDIEKIIAKLNANKVRTIDLPNLPSKRMTILCSATMKMDVQKLGDLSLKDAVHVKAQKELKDGEEKNETSNGDETSFLAPAQLMQSYLVVPSKQRLVTLAGLLKRTFDRRGSVMKAIVFISCSDSVDFHFELFTRASSKETKDGTEGELAAANTFRTSAQATGLPLKANTLQMFKLHGNLTQSLRTSTLAAFRKTSDPSVLICTDVASRGLDLPSIDFVIEYDPPFSKDDHLHRIGRTARAGKDGRATIFLQPGPEENYVEILKQARQEGGREVTYSSSDDILRKGFGSTGLGGGNDWESRATDWQLDVERWALEHPSALEQARRAYQSHIRAYATHIAPERHMFDITELHLGHLAKAFALRDKPGSIKVPGLRPSKDSANKVKSERRARAGMSSSSGGADVTKKRRAEVDGGQDADLADAARRMRKKVREQMSGASEFNLG